MNLKTVITFSALVMAAVIIGPLARADTATITAVVTRVLVTGSTNLGGCMAKLSVDPASVLPLCAPGWVTFSCTGNFTDPVRAYRMLDQAQLALAADKKVVVWITDANRHNGYCFATRIDVVK